MASVNNFLPDPWSVDPPAAILKLPEKGLDGKELASYIQTSVMPLFEQERARLQLLEAWATGQQPTERRHHGQNKEKLALMRFSRNPWLKLMVSTFAQQMIVDGFRKDGAMENESAWDSWLANKMPAQQLTINRTTFTCGYSYVRVTDGVNQFTGEPMATMQAVDPQNAFGIYADPFGDDYPEYLLEKRFDGTWRWWTPDAYSTFNRKGHDWEWVETKPHPYKVVPFVRYVNEIDAKGRTWGGVEPLIEIAARLDKTVLDRLLVQHYNSFKVRWATGLEQPDTMEEVAAAAMKLQHDTLLVSSNDQAHFGVLQETDMEPFIAAYRSDLETFLTCAQLPPDLAGQVANIAADALEGSRRSSYQRLYEMQTMYGESHAQVLRLAAFIEGRTDEATDFNARVHWQDVQIKSLAQFADAWGKIVDQLGVPKWAPWNKIPGVDQSEVEVWKEHLLDDDPVSTYLRELGIAPAPGANGLPGQAIPGPGGPNSTRNQPKLNGKTGDPKSAG